MVYPHSYRTEHSETKTTNSIYGDYYIKMITNKVPIQPQLLKILQFVDSNRRRFLKDLEESIEIQSVSGCAAHRTDVIKMIKFTEEWLQRLGIKYECFNIGHHTLEGKEYRLPPVILGQLGHDSRKKTVGGILVGIYAYLDVKGPDLCKWKTNPWKVTEVDKKLYGNGVAGGKGPLICWFHVVQAFQQQKVDFPVNLKFIIESMYQYDSVGFEEFLNNRKQDFLYNIDCIVVCDSEWFGEKWPCVVYGAVGLLHFEVTIEKDKNSDTDLKSDMENIFKRIYDGDGKILITDFNKRVQQITPDEEDVYEQIQDFDEDKINRDSLPPSMKKLDKVNLLMHFWRLPSIFVDKIEECVCDKKDFSKIKRHFIAKIVPRQIAAECTNLTEKHIKNVVKELGIKNKVEVKLFSESRPWKEDIRSSPYKAARLATMQIYKESPNFVREDRDRKTIELLNRISERTVLLLPLGLRGTNIGGDNENLFTKNFYEGTKLQAAFLFQFALQ